MNYWDVKYYQCQQGKLKFFHYVISFHYLYLQDTTPKWLMWMCCIAGQQTGDCNKCRTVFTDVDG